MTTVTVLSADGLFEEAVDACAAIESSSDVRRVEARYKAMVKVIGGLREGQTVERKHFPREHRTVFAVRRSGIELARAERWEDRVSWSSAAGVRRMYARAQIAALQLATLEADGYDRTGVTV